MKRNNMGMFIATATLLVMAVSAVSQVQPVQAQLVGNDAGRNCGANTAPTNQGGHCIGIGGSFNNGNDAGRNCGANIASTNQQDCRTINGIGNININAGIIG